MQQSFFSNINIPLASKLRPNSLDEYIGQTHLISKGKILRNMIEKKQICSMIFWGPSGVGKTTLAKLISLNFNASFFDFSATVNNTKEIREVLEKAERNKILNKLTILFIDEIHRYNKAQQDVLLKYVENGSIILIGATTENPSFEINSALLSRCKVFVLNKLSLTELNTLLNKAITKKELFNNNTIKIKDSLLNQIAIYSNGDARIAITTLEIAILNSEIVNNTIEIKDDIIEQCTNQKTFLYDKNGEQHYNLISALHKSMRNSDPDAAVYWLARMLESGEDPLYIARRIVRFASEDIGLADTHALILATTVYQACHYLGMPECSVHLTEAVIYLSLAPKSNSLYTTYEKAKQVALSTIKEAVPLQIRNAPTQLMKDLGYSKNYIYAHDTKEKIAHMVCLPETLKNEIFYNPSTEGNELKLKTKLEKIKNFKKHN